MKIIFIVLIDVLFPTEVNRENESDLYESVRIPRRLIGWWVDRLILRTNQLWRSQYEAPLLIIIPKTTLVKFEHTP
jgi:hypothetical protein